MKDTYTSQELALILGVTKRAAEKRAAKEEWPFREETARGGRRRLYLSHGLPEAVRARVAAAECRALAEAQAGFPVQAACTFPADAGGRDATALRQPELTGEPRDAIMARTREAERRLSLLRPLLDLGERAPGRRAVAERLAMDSGVSVQTLYRWAARYARGGLAALMDRPRSDRGQSRVLISSAWEIAARWATIPQAVRLEIARGVVSVIRGLWARQGARSWRQVALLAQADLFRRSVSAGMPEDLARRVCRIPRKFVEAERRFAVAAIAARDAKGFYDRVIPAVTRSRDGLRPGDVVFGDVSPADIPVRRPDGSPGWARLIAWQDAATNMLHVTGYLANPGAGVRREHVALAFCAMCAEAPFGMPRRLYLDNGSEFSWTEMLDAWAELARLSGGAFGGAWGVESLGPHGRVIRSVPFKPRAKSIEGQFGNLVRFFGWHTAFAGSDRLRKKTATLGRGVEPTTIEDLRAFIGEALAFYHGVPQRGHLGGLSPAQAMEEWQNRGFSRTTVEAEALALAFSDRLERKVRAGSVEAGGWHYYAPELHQWEGEKVMVRYPRHAPDAVFVFRGGRLVAVATPMPVFAFADPEGARHAARMAAEARRVVSVMRGQVAWLDPRDLMGEFARMAGVRRVVERASASERRITLSDEAREMIEAKRKAAEAALAAAAERACPSGIIANRYRIEEEPEVAAARALGL